VGALVLFAATQTAILGGTLAESDEGLFGACAVRQILDHALPLTDCVDTKPPGIFVVYEAIYRLFGLYSPIGVRAVAVIAILACAFLVWRTTARLAGPRAGAIAAGIALLFAGSLNFNFALKTEVFAVLLVFVAIDALITWRAAHRSPIAFAAGGAIGVAILFKQPLALMAVAGAVVIIGARASIAARFAALVAYAIGCAAAPIACAAGYAAAGHWGDFVDQIWLRPRLYATLKSPGYSLFGALTAAALAIAAPLAIAGAFGGAALLRRDGDRAVVMRVATVMGPFALASLAFVALGGHYFGSYFVMLWPFVAIAIALGLTRFAQGEGAWRGGALIGAGVALAGFFAVSQAAQLRSASAYAENLGSRIRAAMQPGDRLYVWGYAPELYPATRAVPASRFVATSVLVGFFHDTARAIDPYAGLAVVPAADWQRFFADLRGAGAFILLDASAIRMGAPGNFSPRRYAPMRRFMQRQCRPMPRVDMFEVWRCTMIADR